MKKKTITLFLITGKAKPGQELNPILGQFGINIKDFCNKFNNLSLDIFFENIKIPVILEIYTKNNYTFKIKFPTLNFLIKKNKRTLTKKIIFQIILLKSIKTKKSKINIAWEIKGVLNSMNLKWKNLM